MASERQIAANRANAAKSTGPRSPDGKRESAKNALKHGLRRRRPDSEFERAVTEFAAALCAEDPQLTAEAAEAYARASLLDRLIHGVLEQLTEEAVVHIYTEDPHAPRQDIARLAVLEGPGRPLLAHQARAAAAIRKVLKAMARAEAEGSSPTNPIEES